MATLIRSIHNTSSTNTITLGIPGFDPTESLVVAPSTTVDLLSVMTADALHAMQSQLASLVAAGEVTTVLTIDSSVLYNTAYTAIQSAVQTVGTLSFTNVSADIGTVGAPTVGSTIFTPTVTGLYLLSFYGLATTAPSGADAAPNLYMKWTDEHGLQTAFNFAGNLDMTYTDGPNSITMPIYAVAGQPIWMATAAGNYSGTVRWSFYFTVQKL
jgi:hypothetical protein